MTAIERLRELLDERGVEWWDGVTRCHTTHWVNQFKHSTMAQPWCEGTYKVTLYDLTPEQAIAATLGVTDATAERQGDGTCHADETDTLECVCDQVGRYGKRVTIHVMECSECGRTYEHVNGDYEFCPRCGRRVVEVDG